MIWSRDVDEVVNEWYPLSDDLLAAEKERDELRVMVSASLSSLEDALATWSDCQ